MSKETIKRDHSNTPMDFADLHHTKETYKHTKEMLKNTKETYKHTRDALKRYLLKNSFAPGVYSCKRRPTYNKRDLCISKEIYAY